MSWKNFCFALAAVVLAMATAAPAQFPYFPKELSKETELPTYWIGVALRDSDPALLTHLKLEHGVLVGEVMDDSPAAKAGLQPLDIITRAGEADIKTGDDLLKAVASAKDKELTLSVYREAKPQTIKVTPAKRPEDRVAALPPKAVEGQPREAVERALRLWKDRAKPFEFDLLGPGVVMRVDHPPIPDDMKIVVEREGMTKAKVTVQQGDNSWTATEKEIDTLPEVARPHVRMMLGLPTDRMFTFDHEDGKPHTRGALPRAEVRDRQDPLSRIEAELKRLREDVDELKKK